MQKSWKHYTNKHYKVQDWTELGTNNDIRYSFDVDEWIKNIEEFKRTNIKFDGLRCSFVREYESLFFLAILIRNILSYKKVYSLFVNVCSPVLGQFDIVNERMWTNFLYSCLAPW